MHGQHAHAPHDDSAKHGHGEPFSPQEIVFFQAEDRSAAKASERAEETWQVKRAIERDANAFAELYDRHVVRVYRHIYYVVNDRNAAEDLTAQTFLKAWEAIDRYTDRGTPFIAWLLRIAHNQSISYLRGKHDHS